MSNRKSDQKSLESEVTWSSSQQMRIDNERRDGEERRCIAGRTITGPDMRCDQDRRQSEERRVRLIITSRAMDV